MKVKKFFNKYVSARELVAGDVVIYDNYICVVVNNIPLNGSPGWTTTSEERNVNIVVLTHVRVPELPRERNCHVRIGWDDHVRTLGVVTT